MKTSVRLFLIASGLVLASDFCAAQIAASDFSSSANWSSPIAIEGNGAFSFTDGVLGYTVDSPAGVDNSDTAYTQWMLNTAPITSSWTASIDAHLASMTLTGNQSVNLNFIVATTGEIPSGSSGTNMDQFDIAIDRYSDGSSTHHGIEVSFNAYAGGLNYHPSSTYANTGATDVSLILGFNHLTGLLSAYYDPDGSGAASASFVESYNILSGESSWDLTEGDTFSFVLVGSAYDLIVNPGIATFDNFLVVETSAVPEPGTTAAWLGAAALVLVARRRRRAATAN